MTITINSDAIYSLSLSGGAVYVAGPTKSDTFPGTAGGVQPARVGDWDGFVARLNTNLTSLQQSTYLGGSGLDVITVLSVAASGDVYVTGHTRSKGFPKTTGGAQPGFGGDLDAFISRLSADLKTLHQSTYLGDSEDDYTEAMVISAGGEVYVAGATYSADFPKTG